MVKHRLDIPEVSIVMSVYNGADGLERTLTGIAAQKEVAWECIIINDGSQDASQAILQQIAERDSRFRIFHQENAGLTCALIRGCQYARGQFIARHDCGDVSSPDRVAKQVKYLNENPRAALVSGMTQFLAPCGEKMHSTAADESSHALIEKNQLEKEVLNGFPMPSHHGCTMFRKDLYIDAGEYRREFYFAQDLDLWSRLVEQGEHLVVPDVLYEAQFSLGSISGCYAPEQRMLKDLIFQATSARRAGKDEGTFLEAAALIRTQPTSYRQRSHRLASESYFFASCLMMTQPTQARSYFLKCVFHNPFHLRGWLKLFISSFISFIIMLK